MLAPHRRWRTTRLLATAGLLVCALLLVSPLHAAGRSAARPTARLSVGEPAFATSVATPLPTVTLTPRPATPTPSPTASSPTSQPTAMPAAPLTFTVDSPADAHDAHPGDGVCATTAGPCTLRAAVEEANAQPGGRAVIIAMPAGHYLLSLGPLAVTAHALTIVGAGAAATTISGDDEHRVFTISTAATATIAQVSITGGRAPPAGGDTSVGGGILISGTLAVRASAILSNTAGYSGGGIQNTGTLTIDNSIFRGNAASNRGSDGGQGGALYNRYGTVTLTNSTFSNNRATLGGALYNFDGTMALTNSTLITNSGSGLINSYGTVTLTQSSIISNTGTYGGGIGSSGSVTGGTFGELTLTRSTIRGNTATGDGGGVFLFQARMLLANSTVSGNTASIGGGGLVDDGGALLLSQSSVHGNRASYGGGLESSGGGTLRVRDSTIRGNTASVDGGGLYNFTGISSVLSSTISNNTATNGGGLYNDGGGGGGGGTITVRASTLSGNKATGNGGGLDDAYDVRTCSSVLGPACAGGVTLVNSTVSGNSAGMSGGGIATGGDDPMALTYVTVATNTSGLANIGSSTVILTGTLLAGSTTGPNCRGHIAEAQGYNLDSGTSCGLTRATDLTATNPLLGPLANNGGPTQTMALQPASPAIDQGGTRATGCPATDQRGQPRPDEARDTGACDSGAYESQRLQ